MAARSIDASVHRAELAQPVGFGGPGRIASTVEVKATPANTLVRRRVRLFDERSGRLVRETWSDATTGAYAFEGLALRKYTVISHDHTGAHRAVIADGLMPEVAP